MAELLLDIPFMDFIAAGIAFCGITSAFLIQCGDKRTARKNKSKKGSQKSIKGSQKSTKGSQKSIKAKKSLRQTESKNDSDMSSKKLVRKSERSAKPGKAATSSKRTEVSAISSEIPKVRPANAASSEVAITETTPDKQLSLKSANASKRSNNPTKSTQEDKTEMNVLTAREPAKQTEAENEREKTVTLVPFDAQTGREVSKKEVPLSLLMEPKELQFSGNGAGLMRVQLHNPTDTRRAIKIKCSDNAIYRVNPVYGYVEPGQNLSIEIVRRNGQNSKIDKLVFVTAKAPLGNMSVKDLFKSAPKGDLPLMTLPLRAA